VFTSWLVLPGQSLRNLPTVGNGLAHQVERSVVV
jgi:hypothetical protein